MCDLRWELALQTPDSWRSLARFGFYGTRSAQQPWYVSEQQAHQQALAALEAYALQHPHLSQQLELIHADCGGINFSESPWEACPVCQHRGLRYWLGSEGANCPACGWEQQPQPQTVYHAEDFA